MQTDANHNRVSIRSCADTCGSGATYSIVFDAGRDPETGKRRQQWRSGFKTKKEAEAGLARLIHRVERGSDPFPSNQTVREFVEQWLEHQRARLRPTTHYRYSQLWQAHVLPVIGETRLDRLRPAHIQKAMDAMSAQGQSPASVVQARAALGSAISTAVAWGLLAVNPVRSVKPPRVQRAPLVVPTVEQLRAVIDVAQGSVWEVLVLLATTTGMRRSEVLALRWCDVDLKAGRVRVTRSLQRMVDGSVQVFDPKTTRARREIALPAFTVPALERHRRGQREARRRAAMPWDEFQVVCDRGDGQPIDPSTFTHAFKRLAREAGIPPEVRLHDARHAVATAMLERKVHPAIASAVLGHASESFTMSTYQHVNPRMTEAAAEALDDALRGDAGP